MPKKCKYPGLTDKLDTRMMKRLDTELMRNRRIKLLFDRVTIVIIMEWSGITKINLEWNGNSIVNHNVFGGWTDDGVIVVVRGCVIELDARMVFIYAPETTKTNGDR